MRKMKKILAFVMAMAMVLGMSVTSFAETPTVDPNNPDGKIGTSDDKGTITINGFEFNGTLSDVPEKFEVYAYPIIKAQYEKSNNSDTVENESFKMYVPLYTATDLDSGAPVISIDTKETDVDGNAVTENDLEKVLITEEMLNAIIKKLPPTTTTGDKAPIKMDLTKVETTGTGESTITTFKATKAVNVGAYLIMVTGAESKVYNPMVASVYYTNKSQSDNDLNNGTVEIKGSNSWVKVSDTPQVTKNIVENNTIQNHGSVNIGDTITYQVEINPVPQYGGDYPVLNVVDTLSEGLDFVANSVEVNVYGKSATFPYTSTDATKLDSLKYSVKTEEKKEDTSNPDKKTSTEITIDFVKNGIYALNEGWVEGNKAVITYQAKLNDNAAINQGGNENAVKLNYTKDSKINSDDDEDIIPDNPPKKTYSYTFDLDGGAVGSHTDTTITEGILVKINGEVVKKEDKVDTEKITNALSGAEFTLYTKNPEELGEGEKAEDFIYTNDSIVKADGTTFDGKVTSTEEGLLPIRGLKAGTYYLKETKAPKDYSLNTHVFKIEIVAHYYGDPNVTLPTGEDAALWEKGQLVSWDIIIDDSTSDKGKNSFTVKHEKEGDVTKITAPEDSANKGLVAISNTKLSALPSTGGIGTTIFTIGGCAIMIIAAGLFFASRRKSGK